MKTKEYLARSEERELQLFRYSTSLSSLSSYIEVDHEVVRVDKKK